MVVKRPYKDMSKFLMSMSLLLILVLHFATKIEQLQPTYITFLIEQFQQSFCLNQKISINIWWLQIPP
jgi:hypothetical protein